MPLEITEQAVYIQTWVTTAQIVVSAIASIATGSCLLALLFYRVRQIEKLLTNGLSHTVNSMDKNMAVVLVKVEKLEENCLVHRQLQSAQTQVNVTPSQQ